MKKLEEGAGYTIQLPQILNLYNELLADYGNIAGQYLYSPTRPPLLRFLAGFTPTGIKQTRLLHHCYYGSSNRLHYFLFGASKILERVDHLNLESIKCLRILNEINQRELERASLLTTIWKYLVFISGFILGILGLVEKMLVLTGSKWHWQPSDTWLYYSKIFLLEASSYLFSLSILWVIHYPKIQLTKAFADLLQVADTWKSQKTKCS